MEFLIIAALAIVGFALVAGGFVAYRRSEATVVKALAAAAVAAGGLMLALAIFVTPIGQTTGN
jgi:hypothetical protein